jgi:hypothetical protein
MKGAQFIVLYTSADGKNVTVSPRAGDDLIPILNPGARLELLKGSGVENGIMTANIKCELRFNRLKIHSLTLRRYQL